MNAPISILIPNYNGHEALELCIESILARTQYQDHEITVLNNPGDGKDREYLQSARDAGYINLIETERDYRPGEAMSILFSKCGTPIACHLESDTEIINKHWLSTMVNLIEDEEKDIAVARFFGPGPHCNTWYAPTWGPECILLNMKPYRKIAESHDWQQRSLPIEDYKHKYIFDGMMPPTKFNGTVNCDTGWRFAEKILFENKWGFRVKDLPPMFFGSMVIHYGGISTRGENLEIQPRWEKIRRRLAELRSA